MNPGSLFCLRRSDKSNEMVDQGNFIADGSTRLYVNRIDEFDTDLGVARALRLLPFEPVNVAIESSVVTIPEPGTALLVLLGGGALLLCRRRSHRTAAASVA